MSDLPACPACQEEITYPDRENYVCATCGHEWPMDGSEVTEDSDAKVVRDAHGTPLADGEGFAKRPALQILRLRKEALHRAHEPVDQR